MEYLNKAEIIQNNGLQCGESMIQLASRIYYATEELKDAN
jgi:hypothetical protein